MSTKPGAVPSLQATTQNGSPPGQRSRRWPASHLCRPPQGNAPGTGSRGGNRQANAAIHRILLLRRRHQEPRTKAYFDRRRAEGLTDRDITRCLKRHIANEIYAALLNAGTENPTGKALRAERRRIGIPITVLAATLGVPYQRLRRLEIGTRADPELEQRAILALTHISPQRAA